MEAHYSSFTFTSSYVNNIERTPTKHNKGVLTSMNREQQKRSYKQQEHITKKETTSKKRTHKLIINDN
jgi:hypothetical protein